MVPLFWRITAETLVLIPSAFATSHLTGNTTKAPTGNTKSKVIELFNPLKNETVGSLLSTLLQGLTALAIPVVTVMIIIGAYYMITSGGNPGRVSKGKDYILWAVIGFAFLLLATSITTIIENWVKSNQT
jgi:hypothetical protein